MQYRQLELGEILQSGDEYHNGTTWKSVPAFMIGDKIKSKDTWGRLTSTVTKANQIPEEHWIISHFKRIIKGFSERK